MKKINFHMTIILFFMVINTGCSAKTSTVIEFANTLYATDLSPKGTHQISTGKNRDNFYNVSRTKPVSYQGRSYFQSNGDFYQSDGLQSGTQKYEGFDANIFNPTVHENRFCYHERGRSVYCLDMSNNRVQRSTLLELERGKNISKIASGVLGNRLLILTRDNELWISGEGAKSPTLLVSKVYQKDISKILVTKNIVYFISNASEKVNYFYNYKKVPKKVQLSYINISKTKYSNKGRVADNIITDGIYLYFMKSNGSIHRVNALTLALGSTNSTLIDNFHRLIGVMDNHILYSTMSEEKISCNKFRHKYELHSVNISTGQIEELATKEQSVQTVGGCYKQPRPIPPMPISTWTPLKDKNYPSSAYSLREDVAYFELRKYLFKQNKQVSNNYIPYLSIYRKKLSSFPSKIVKSFQKIPFDEKKWTGLTTKKLDSTEYAFKVKGFIIKTDNKFWVINEKKDMAWLFDKIDTEAEVYQFMKMYEPYGRKIENSYKKTSLGYDVKQVQIEYKSEIEVTKNGYDEYLSYQLYSTYIYHINANGKFTKEFISTGSKNRKRSKVLAGLHGDPMFGDSRTPDEIFSTFGGVVRP
jgi:hypothetical protein